MTSPSAAGMQGTPGLCPVRAGVENAKLRHVMPFALVLVLGLVVGLLAVSRAFLDGEIFDAGTMALILICYVSFGLWVLQRARISSPRDRVPLFCGTVVVAAALMLYAWADAEELVVYQTFYESGSDEFEKGLGLAVGGGLGLASSGAPRAATGWPAAHARGALPSSDDQDHGAPVHAYPDSDDARNGDHGVHAYPDGT